VGGKDEKRREEREWWDGGRGRMKTGERGGEESSEKEGDNMLCIFMQPVHIFSCLC